MIALKARVEARVVAGHRVQYMPGMVRARTLEAVPRYTVLLDTGEMLVDIAAADVRLVDGLERAA